MNIGEFFSERDTVYRSVSKYERAVVAQVCAARVARRIAKLLNRHGLSDKKMRGLSK